MLVNTSVLVSQKGDPRITACAYDAADYKNAEDYCNMYIELLCIDRRYIDKAPKFYIKKFIKAMEKIPRKSRDKLEKFFGLKGGAKHYLRAVNPKDLALQNLISDATDAAAYLQSFASIYIWHEESRKIIDAIAKKVYDPKNYYSNVQKAKFAHLYYRYIKDFQYMPYDEKNGKTPLSPEQISVEGKVFAVADLLTDEYKIFFQYMKDGDIIPDMTLRFLENLSLSDRRFIENDCQLIEDKYCCYFLGEVRKVKENIFSNGEWFGGSYCTFSEIKKLTLNRMYDLCSVCKFYYANNINGWKGNHTRRRKILLMSEGYKNVFVQEFIGKRTFADIREMLQFISAINYLEQYVPDFKFHRKSFLSYQFSAALR